MLILCSENSVSRPWINFEAGAGWLRNDIPVIPICHTGMTKNNLPLPLKLLQGIDANQESELRSLYSRIAKTLGSSVPSHDFAEFAARVVDFEHEYGFAQHFRDHVAEIVRILPSIAPLLAPGAPVRAGGGMINQSSVDEMRPHLDWLRAHDLLMYNTEGASGIAFGTRGSALECTFNLAIEDAYYEAAAKINR